MLLTCLTLLVMVGMTVASIHPRSSIEERDFQRCHQGIRDTPRRCNEYVNLEYVNLDPSSALRAKREVDKSEFPDMAASCLTVAWTEGKKTNNWGSCKEEKVDTTHRYIRSNTVPDFYYNPYCPIGLGYGYCTQQEIDLGRCMFPESVLKCGGDNGAGSTDYGDVWVPVEAFYKIPLVGNPTRSDRPRDMYDADAVGAGKSVGAALGVATNGIGIWGPNDAGDISIDEAGFQLTCGGHVTPPLAKVDSSIFPAGAPPATPPVYHFHKAPECLEPYQLDYKGIARGATPNKHGRLTGWALDGFGIYTFQDVGGKTPVVDECGGHFGPVSDDSDEVVYHYHTRPYVPYTLACQGPALGKCKETQGKTANYCHYGCGAEVCVQPGTKESKLREYLKTWSDTWLDGYTRNDYMSGATQVRVVVAYFAIVAHFIRFGF